MVGRSSQVARGLNTIAANIVANRDALKNFGIQVETSSGELRSTYDVLSDLSKIWDDLDDTTKVTLGTMLAGKNQYKVLASVMSNFATATNATATALDSAGSAAKENERYMESIEAKVTAVSAAFQQMATAVVDSDVAKGVLDIVKAFAEFGSTGVGSAITQILLLSGVSWGGLQLLGQSILPGIINSFKLLSGVSLSVLSAETGISELAIALGASLPYILAVTTAIVGLVNIVEAWTNAYHEAHLSTDEALGRMEQAKTELKETEEGYNKAKERLDELNATPFEARTPEIREEIAQLQQLISYYEQIVELRKGQASYSASLFIKAAEREGVPTSGYILKGEYADYESAFGSEISDSIHQIEGAYNSVEEAVYAAATAVLEFDEDIEDIDVENVAELQNYLKEYGITIEENRTSLENFFNDVGNQFTTFTDYLRGEQEDVITNPTNFERLTAQYKNLISLSEDYIDALKLIDETTLKDYEINFLKQFDEMVSVYESFLPLVRETDELLPDSIKKFIGASETLGFFAQNLLSAKTAYEQFKTAMEQSGDYDDSFKGLVSVFGELNGEWEKGQVGSKAFLTALELLTGQTFDSSSATEYLNEHLEILSLLFNDAESGGSGLITAMQKLDEQNKLNGASIKTVDGGIEVSITSFADLAKSLGISEGALYSMTQALKVMGINFEYNVDDMIKQMEKLGEGIVETGGDTETTTVHFDKFVEQAKAAGRSTDEILQIAEVLQNASGVNLTGIDEGLALLGVNSDDGAEAAGDLADNLEDVGGTAYGVSDTANAVQSLASNLGNAASSSTTLYSNLSALSNLKFPSLFGNAEGTNYAEEGDSLVNEEGPEIIQSGDEAYIAGGGMPTITHLHRGDRVFTADETEDILKGKNITSIQAHAGKGTTKSTVGINKTETVTISNETLNKMKDDSSSSSSSSSSSKSGSSKSSKSSSSESAAKTAKDEFDAWLKAKKHALAMDEITEKEYYEELEKMNEKYFKDSEEYKDEYWKYQEEVYKWRKKQLEEENELLEKRLELEKALGELAKAKEQKILVYKDGHFQYIEDIDAIAKATEEVGKLASEAGLSTITSKSSKVTGYGFGTLNSSAGLHLVGENGPELRVLNNGDGIIPSDITKNLLNLAKLNSYDLISGIGKSLQTFYSFNIDNLTLPSVKDANGFLEGLKNYAYQYSFT